MYNPPIQYDESNVHYPYTDWMLFVLYVFSIFLAITSNSIILLIFYKKKKTKSATYVLMSNMSIADLMSSSFILLQWYFCSTNFFANESTNLSFNHTNQLATQRTLLFNSLKPNHFYTNLPVQHSSSSYSPNNISTISQIDYAINNTFDKQNFSLPHNQNSSLQQSYLDEIRLRVSRINFSGRSSDDKMVNKLTTNDRTVKKTINESIKRTNLPLSITETNARQLDPINRQIKPSIDHFTKTNAQQIVERNSNFYNDQDASSESETSEIRLKDHSREDDLLGNLENNENFRKKRTFDSSPVSSADAHHTVELLHRTNDELSNADDELSEGFNGANEKSENSLNQIINGDKLIKSNFIRQMPNCGQRVCAILETLQMSVYYVSTLTMLGIAYNRWILINRPLSPKIDTTLFLVIIWVTSVTIALLASLSSLRVFVFFTKNRFIDCRIILGSNDAWNLRKWRAIILMIIQYVLPLSAILFLYIAVINELKKCGLKRTKHQSSTSSNTVSIDHYLMNRRYTNPAFDYGSMKRNSTFIDQSEIFKISLNERPEINNNLETYISNDLKFTDSTESFNQSRLTGYLKSINLVDLPVVKKFKKQAKPKVDVEAKPTFVDYRSKSVRERLSNRLIRIMNRKLMNSEYMNKSQSSNESPTASFTNQLTSSNSISAKLNILDDQLDRTKRRVTKMMIVVVILFASAWFPVSRFPFTLSPPIVPVHAMHLKQFFIDTYDDSNYCDSSFLYLFFYWIAFSTFCYNPIVYLYFSKELRRDTLLTLRSLFACFRIKNILKRTRTH